MGKKSEHAIKPQAQHFLIKLVQFLPGVQPGFETEATFACSSHWMMCFKRYMGVYNNLGSPGLHMVI